MTDTTIEFARSGPLRPGWLGTDCVCRDVALLKRHVDDLFDDVVDVTSFSTDSETQFEPSMEVPSDEIGEAPYPNWSAVGVEWLCRFRHDGLRCQSSPHRAEDYAPPTDDIFS